MKTYVEIGLVSLILEIFLSLKGRVPGNYFS